MESMRWERHICDMYAISVVLFETKIVVVMVKKKKSEN